MHWNKIIICFPVKKKTVKVIQQILHVRRTVSSLFLSDLYDTCLVSNSFDSPDLTLRANTRETIWNCCYRNIDAKWYRIFETVIQCETICDTISFIRDTKIQFGFFVSVIQCQTVEMHNETQILSHYEAKQFSSIRSCLIQWSCIIGDRMTPIRLIS